MSPTEDIVLDLNFVPAWARRPPDHNPYADFKGRSGATRNRVSDPRGGRPWNRSGPAPRESFSGRRRGVAEKDGRGAPRDMLPGRDTDRPGFTTPGQDALLEVSFIPERRGLKPLARLFARTGQAYSLMEVASMFLSRPEFFAVKLEVSKNGDAPAPFTLHQCKECQALFLSRESAMLHGVATHFDLFYDQEETRSDPPKGKFVCVTRCGLSGVLLGPPNYHEYNERLLELHRTRFASMPLEAYRKKLVNETDPAFIEQWKQEVCRKLTYRTRRENPPQLFKRRSQVEAHFRDRVAPGLIREGRRFIVSGPASRLMEDPAVTRAIRRAWTRETRFPLKMTLALHPAFRSYGLHIFKTPDKTTFVTAIHPHPMDSTKTLEVIRRILDYLVAHPGTGRMDLVESLLPGLDPDSPPVADMITQLRWLIDKGHIIEFSNGKLAVPYRKAPAPRQENTAAAKQ